MEGKEGANLWQINDTLSFCLGHGIPVVWKEIFFLPFKVLCEDFLISTNGFEHFMAKYILSAL